MIRKTEEEIKLMRKACEITGNTLKHIKNFIKPGISTLELDKIAKKYILENDAIPTFLNYNGYPASICASVNNVVVHGIPRADVILKEGDIISIDVGAEYKGYTGDAARTFPVGEISKEKERLIRVTEECFFEGIKHLKVGHRLGELSHAIQKHAEFNGYSVVRELVGHGVGKNMHEEPSIPNYGYVNSGPIVESNVTLAIEPMINMGGKKIYMAEDGWTIVTADGKPSAHYENTVLVTENGVEILTL